MRLQGRENKGSTRVPSSHGCFPAGQLSYRSHFWLLARVAANHRPNVITFPPRLPVCPCISSATRAGYRHTRIFRSRGMGRGGAGQEEEWCPIHQNCVSVAISTLPAAQHRSTAAHTHPGSTECSRAYRHRSRTFHLLASRKICFSAGERRPGQFLSLLCSVPPLFPAVALHWLANVAGNPGPSLRFSTNLGKLDAFIREKNLLCTYCAILGPRGSFQWSYRNFIR